MDGTQRKHRLLQVALAAVAASLCWLTFARQPVPPAPELKVGMWVTVAADGSVTGVEPGPDVPGILRAGLVKRVSQFHFSAPMWQQHAVSQVRWFTLRLQPVATTSGGYALRVLGEAFLPDPRWRGMRPPEYPAAAQRQGIGGEFVYAVHVETDGSVHDMRLLSPEEAPTGLSRDLDKAARAAINKWVLKPEVVDGAAIACDIAFPIVFTVSTERVGKLPDHVPTDHPKWDAGPLACPRTELKTEIQNSLL